MSPLRLIYLGLAILGALSFALQFPGAVPAIGGHGMMSGQGSDLLIVAITLTVWAVAETSVRRNWEALLAIPVTFLIGVGCGLPLYLFLRTRPVR